MLGMMIAESGWFDGSLDEPWNPGMTAPDECSVDRRLVRGLLTAGSVLIPDQDERGPEEGVG